MDDTDESENRLYARRQYSTIRQMKSGLPNIPGVFALSKTEVKKDVREMERNVNDDTDSDSSILSEDVLVSSYPVKPRKAPKVMIPVKPISTGPTDVEREYDGKAVDQTLTFLDAVRRTKKDLYAAECERERLEDQNLSYRLSIDDTSKRYRQVKQDEGNYFRVIQGFHTQALRLQMGLNRQNAMFYDVINALKRRKDAAKSVADETIHLKKLAELSARAPQLASACSNASATLSTGVYETAVLRVDLKRGGGQVVLFKDQWIRTPMGDAKILSIQPRDERIVLQLPFGKMYANLRRAVCWGKASSSAQLLELSSDEMLRQRWTALQSSFFMPAEVSRGIRTLVGQSDDEAVTDKDDDNSNDDTSPTDTVTEEQNGSTNGLLPSAQPGDGHVDGAASSGPHTDSSSSVCSFPLKGFTRSTAPTPQGTLTRQALKLVCTDNSATESVLSHQRDVSRTLPLVFVPPGSLPCLIEKSQATETPEVRYCQHSLTGGGQTGTVGSLAWDGDVIEMSRELGTLQDEIDRLEAEQNHYIGQIQSVRSRCAQLSTDTSGLRLAIFTRRVRHRNNLNTHLTINQALQAASLAPAPPPAYTFTEPHNGVHGDAQGSAAATSLRLSRGIANSIIKDEGGNGSSRSSTRLVSAIPGGGIGAAAGSTSPFPEGNVEKRVGYDLGDKHGADVAASNGASRKRGREPLPTVEILTSSRRRSAPNTASANETDFDPKDPRRSLGSAPSSSANMDEEDDEEEIKEEVGSQEDEEVEAEAAISGPGTGRGGARTAGGFGGKKKPRKQRRI